MSDATIYTVVIEETHKETDKVSSSVLCNRFTLQEAIDVCSDMKIPTDSLWNVSFVIYQQEEEPEWGAWGLVGFRDGELQYYRNGGKQMIDRLLEEEAASDIIKEVKIRRRSEGTSYPRRFFASDPDDASKGSTTEKVQSKYTVKVYVKHGYFEYQVSELSSALEHAQLITEYGAYRRSNSKDEVEFHQVVKVKVCGEGLASDYPDTFKRT